MNIVFCVDVDECQNIPPICDPLSTCINKVGSYSCRCNPGYITAPNSTCIGKLVLKVVIAAAWEVVMVKASICGNR